jgi:predicted nucleic acid-binding protein
MSPVVADASVALKWVLDEDFSDRAEALFNDTVGQGLPIFAPPHLTSEVTNALYRRSLRREHAITAQVADEALITFLSFPIRLMTPANLYPEALRFARAHRVGSIYDSLYVVLAQLSGSTFWTADRSLLRGLGSAAPWVHWIGEYPGVG